MTVSAEIFSKVTWCGQTAKIVCKTNPSQNAKLFRPNSSRPVTKNPQAERAQWLADQISSG